MRPVANSAHQTVLHRIVVNVINMAREIGIVADRVLPITALPKRKLAICVPLDINALSE
jgi:hypothetical protein